MKYRIFFCFAVLFAITPSLGNGEWEAEGNGLEIVTGQGGLVLVQDPLYLFVRPPAYAGALPEGKNWIPGFLQPIGVGVRQLPMQWKIPSSGVKVTTGNEVGDALFQELQGNFQQEGNRTPMMHLLLAPPTGGLIPFVEFWQVDHFGGRYSSWRARQVKATQMHAWFGANRPGVSRLFGGVSDSAGRGQIVAGQEYLWLAIPRGDWLPLRVQRWQGSWVPGGGLRLDFMQAWEHLESLQLNARHAQWQFSAQYFSDLNPEFHLVIGTEAVGSRYNGEWPLRKSDTHQIIPWGYLRFKRGQWLASAWTAFHDNSLLHRDTLAWESHGENSKYMLSLRSQTGVTENPLGPDTLVLDEQRQLLRNTGRFWVPSLLGTWEISEKKRGGRLWIMPWGHYGAPLKLNVERIQPVRENEPWMRIWDPVRHPGWIGGLQWGVEGRYSHKNLLDILAGYQREHTRGDWQGLELIPPDWMFWLGSTWKLPGGLLVDHSLQWKSTVRWMNWDIPYTVGRTFRWNGAIEQVLHSGRLVFRAEWLHVLLGQQADFPGGEWDRTRFLVHVRWNW